MMIHRIIGLLVCLTCISAYAISDEVMQCHKIVVAGDSKWPPYTIVNDKEVSGAGIDLVKKIFAELDVPVQQVAYDDPNHMMQGLRDGEIDLIVSTYKNPAMSYDVLLLEPAYTIDPITVAVPTSLQPSVTMWESLASLSGVSEKAFAPDEDTSEFIQKYLHVVSAELFPSAIQSVVAGVYKYIIGSENQLNYSIKANSLGNNLIVMRNLTKGGDVHMAFSNNSACKQYAIYVQKRLQDYKNNGTVEKTLRKYIN